MNSIDIPYTLRYKYFDKTTNRTRKIINSHTCPYGNNQMLIYKIAEVMYSISDNEVDMNVDSYDEFCYKYTDFIVRFIKEKMYERYIYPDPRYLPDSEELDITPLKEQIFQIYRSFA